MNRKKCKAKNIYGKPVLKQKLSNEIQNNFLRYKKSADFLLKQTDLVPVPELLELLNKNKSIDLSNDDKVINVTIDKEFLKEYKSIFFDEKEKKLLLTKDRIRCVLYNLHFSNYLTVEE